MKNGDFFTFENDSCPVHKTELKREYTFGFGIGDAAVFTFTGCNCAVCLKTDGFKNKAQYFTSYNLAAGTARLHTAKARVW